MMFRRGRRICKESKDTVYGIGQKQSNPSGWRGTNSRGLGGDNIEDDERTIGRSCSSGAGAVDTSTSQDTTADQVGRWKDIDNVICGRIRHRMSTCPAVLCQFSSHFVVICGVVTQKLL